MTSIQCQSCGKTISGQSLFCPYCGAKLQPQEATIPAGTIAGMGKHEELLENCEIYREIALSQLSEEELKGAV